MEVDKHLLVDVRDDGWSRMQVKGAIISWPPEDALKVAYALIKVTTREYPDISESRLKELMREVDKVTLHDREQGDAGQ